MGLGLIESRFRVDIAENPEFWKLFPGGSLGSVSEDLKPKTTASLVRNHDGVSRKVLEDPYLKDQINSKIGATYHVRI